MAEGETNIIPGEFDHHNFIGSTDQLTPSTMTQSIALIIKVSNKMIKIG
jgi:hypothetical protein